MGLASSASCKSLVSVAKRTINSCRSCDVRKERRLWS